MSSGSGLRLPKPRPSDARLGRVSVVGIVLRELGIDPARAREPFEVRIAALGAALPSDLPPRWRHTCR